MFEIPSFVLAACLLCLLGTSLTSPAPQFSGTAENSETLSEIGTNSQAPDNALGSQSPEATAFPQVTETTNFPSASENGAASQFPDGAQNNGGFNGASSSSNTETASNNGGFNAAGSSSNTETTSNNGGFNVADPSSSTETPSNNGGLNAGGSSSNTETAPNNGGSNGVGPNVETTPRTGSTFIYPTDTPVVDCVCVQNNQCDPSVPRIDPRFESNSAASKCKSTEFCCPRNSVLNNIKTTEPQCGRRTISTEGRLIVPKTATEFGEFPWMALIYKKVPSANGKSIDNVFICGASLLSQTVVLTAAHCVKYMNNDTKVRVGDYNIAIESAADEPKPYQERSISAIIQHKNFDSVRFHNDFALLVVSERFELDSHITPICIPAINSEFKLDTLKVDKTQCIATGWGKHVFDRDGEYQKTLKQIPLSIVDREHCEKQLKGTRLGSNFTLHSSLLCAGGKPGVDACKGDGGGPLICPLIEDPNRFVQVGITAAGLSCGTAVPALYASLLDEYTLAWLSTQFIVSTPSVRSQLN